MNLAQQSPEIYSQIAERALAHKSDPQALSDLLGILQKMSVELAAIEKRLQRLSSSGSRGLG